MDDLLAHTKAHFDRLDDRLACFSEQEVQVEGWFKGEMLFLLTALKQQKLIHGFGREVRTGRGKADLTLERAGIIHWIELKHWLVGVQRGARLDPPFYFGDPTSVGLTQDYDKLAGITPSDQKWFLVLCTANPGDNLWQRGLATFHRKFSPRILVPRSCPSEFPNSYFLGLLRIGAE